MNNEHQTWLVEVSTMLAKAKELNENGQYGEALKQAHHASECVAVAYLLTTTGKRLPPNDTTYDFFAKTVREPSRHPVLLQKIREIVGDVCALREVYEPALLDETISQDAQQMISCVASLAKLIVELSVDIVRPET